MRIAINGLGRIGRTALKTIISSGDWGKVRQHPDWDFSDFEVVAVNDLGNLEDGLAYLIQNDSVYGVYPEIVEVLPEGKKLKIGSNEIHFFSEKDPLNLPWKDLKIDLVLECTGALTDFTKARSHIEAGARQVIISANGKGEGPTLVLGTDSMKLFADQSADFSVVSAGSCTTNCVAPLIQILHDNYQVKKAQMLTVHAVTSSQSLVDQVSKNLRRSRAAFTSMIPQPTGAAVAVGKVIPSLAKVLSGSAVRVPAYGGSLIEVFAHVGRSVSEEEINNLFRKVSKEEYSGILFADETDGIVSADIVGQPISTVVDLPLTEVLEGDLVKVVAWYDNEYGYVCRLLALAKKISQ